jgi:hypothetical protein
MPFTGSRSGDADLGLAVGDVLGDCAAVINLPRLDLGSDAELVEQAET